jgi:hypothetical protein
MRSVDYRRRRGRSLAKNFECHAWQRTPCRQVPRERNEFRRFRQAAMQEKVSHFLERGVRREIF